VTESIDEGLDPADERICRRTTGVAAGQRA
jgi:hypothetical protein